MGQPFLRIENVTKQFGRFTAVDRISLDIAEGEFLTIVGPSGSGKSTLIRLLVGIDDVTEGTISLNGARIDNMPADKRPTCMVFQSLALFPHMTVGQNIEFPLKVRKMAADARRARTLELLALLRLPENYYGKRISQCSGGERQRVALARALIHRPRLLLLDEPLGALDALTRIEMQRLIEGIWRQHGFTAVLVTHDVSEAVALADRILLIEEGRITLDEPVALPRPREHGQPAFAALERRVLKRLMSVDAINVRNRLPGRIVDIAVGRPLSEVRIETAAGIVTAVVSTRGLHEQPLELGAEVLALFKSNEVVLACAGESAR